MASLRQIVTDEVELDTLSGQRDEGERASSRPHSPRRGCRAEETRALIWIRPDDVITHGMRFPNDVPEGLV